MPGLEGAWNELPGLFLIDREKFVRESLGDGVAAVGSLKVVFSFFPEPEKSQELDRVQVMFCVSEPSRGMSSGRSAARPLQRN